MPVSGEGSAMKSITGHEYSRRYLQFLELMRRKLEKARPRMEKRELVEPVYAADNYTVLAEYEWEYLEVEVGSFRLSLGRRGRRTS